MKHLTCTHAEGFFLLYIFGFNCYCIAEQKKLDGKLKWHFTKTNL